MPANLSEVEKANWLQLKYSIKMDVATLSSFLLEEQLQPTQAVSKYNIYTKQYCG